MPLLIAAALMAPGPLRAQNPGDPGVSKSETLAVVPASAPYVRPTESMKLHNHFFDAFGPYRLTVSAFAAGHAAREDESAP
jgi:hypothetical protein